MRAPLRPVADRLELIEAVLFALLHRATPDEAVPAVARRLAAVAPAYTEGEIAARLGAPLAEAVS